VQLYYAITLMTNTLAGYTPYNGSHTKIHMQILNFHAFDLPLSSIERVTVIKWYKLAKTGYFVGNISENRNITIEYILVLILKTH
jgi:hypothetical protein